MKTALYSRRRSISGFTLVETIFAAAIFMFVAGALAWMTIDTTRMGNVVGNSATLQSQARTELDKFTADAHASTQMLTTYTSGTTTYSSDTSSTLILSAPSYNSSGIIAGSTDYIIYQLQGSNFHRIVYTATGSSRTSGDQVIANNVQSVSFTYIIDQQFYGDGTTTSFTLNSAVAGSGTGLVKTVTENGTNQAVGTITGVIQFQAPPTGSTQGTLVFPTAPASNAWIDAVYSVDPTVALNQTNVTGVIMNLTLTSTNPGLGGSATQTTVMSGLTNLHNHPPAPVTQ